MRVFVTGAPGFIGSAVVQELLQNGHQVLGLARSDASADKVSKAGAEVHRGDLEDLESLKSGARDCDGVIHLAFLHDFANFMHCCEVDQAAIQAMGEAIEGTGKPLVIASGILLLPQGKLCDEDTETNWEFPLAFRGKAETLVAQLSKEKNILGSSVRLSPTVHGKGDKGFVPMLADFAKKNGFVTQVGDGRNHWTAVHRLDSARLFRLVLEKGKAGAVYHGVAEEGVEMRQILEAIAKHNNLKVETKSSEEAQQAIGFFALATALDVIASILK